ncbi:heterokaryon incompatibility protein-domain-containing protein [Clohesyomyces aquaticus]|uniref:Heterokaryon incompatibility protein-domain-containing protein n=1 Tax=Clohesyomyces aquaticus TaxID=1231657 RepID=A0A1Y1ZLG9_9PLEO|nr:heterokaryon incompatibility protein-domain-containing protein [Clohesyomyces aquaticus]
MSSLNPCACCAQLFLNPALVGIDGLDHYDWARETGEILASAAHGCSFCSLLQRSFRLDHWKGAQNANLRKPPSKALGEIIIFQLSWNKYGDKIENLDITAEEVEAESDLLDWGLDGLLFSLSARVSYRVMTSKGDPATSIVRSILPSRTNNFKRSLVQANSWKTNCEKEHVSCKKLGKGPLPTRILDLECGNGLNRVRLRDDLAGHPGQYVCLSYCWGSAQSMVTRDDTIGDYKLGIDLVSLPRTIQNAVQVTKGLNMRYLWVDALCILQDSDEDKAKQCAQMDRIYERAYVTISAANTDDCHEGFLTRESHIRNDFPSLPIACPDGRRGSIYFHWESEDPLKDPIQDRAWTLQEHVLSPRLLIWSKYQMMWLCTTNLEQEEDIHYNLSGPYNPFGERFPGRFGQSNLAGLHKILSGKAPGAHGHCDFRHAPGYIMDEMQSTWEQIMVEYSRRKLSVKSDNLPALSGLVSRFRDFVQDDYLAGHWRKWLLPHLLWKCIDEKGGARHSYCPTWSWLSVDGPITIESLSASSIQAFIPQPAATIIRCTTTPLVTSAPYGRITSGELLIRGYVKAVTVHSNERQFDLDYPYDLTPTEQILPKITLDDPTAFWERTETRAPSIPSNSPHSDKVWCLPLFITGGESDGHAVMVRGLVLAKVDRSRYQRVGWFFGAAKWCYRERSKGLFEKYIIIV